MQLNEITPVILCWNEAPNIRRTLMHLSWASNVVIVDSGSEDETESICREFANVSWYVRTFDDHATQWNYAVAQADSSWILSLDADYVLGDEWPDELKRLQPSEAQTAFFSHFRYLVFGRSLKASILPARAVLFRSGHSHYRNDGHTQVLDFEGESGVLKSRIDHDDRKPLSRWLMNQDRYARLEAEKLSMSHKTDLSRADRIRRMKWIAPWLVPTICLLRSGIFLDGWRGWYYAFQRALAEMLLALRLIEKDEA